MTTTKTAREIVDKLYLNQKDPDRSKGIVPLLSRTGSYNELYIDILKALSDARNDALEEAAKACEDVSEYGADGFYYSADYFYYSKAIRKLKEAL